MSFPPYASYKDSGVEWLGEVPRDWQIQPLLSVASECRRSGSGLGETNLLSLSYGRVIPKDINSNDGLLPESFDTYQVVMPGEIIWRLTDLQNDKRSLRTALVEERGIITSAYLATAPLAVDSRFFAYLLRAYDTQKVFYSMGGGLRQSIKFADVRRMPILLPSPGEQRAIADFLNRETAKIDASVEAQRRLIALLKEKRQAVISHAVTKGLDPSAPLKPSGVDGLGDVPAHWEVKRVKLLGSFAAGAGFPHEEQGIKGEELGFYKVAALGCADGEGFLTEADHTVSREVAARLRAFVFPFGTIVFAKIGAALMLARFRQLRTNACLDNNMMGFTANRDNDPGFLLYAFETCVQFPRIVNPGAVPSLNEGQIANTVVAIPTLAEQQAIVLAVNEQLMALAALGNQVDAATTLLAERRAALISAAVTGKIDVRGLEAAPKAAEAA